MSGREPRAAEGAPDGLDPVASPARSVRFAALRGLLAALAVVAAGCSNGGDHVRRPLHLRVGPLPACEYGLAYERPLVLELRGAEGPIVQARTTGLDTGEASRWVSLYADEVRGGRFELALGRCPPLRPDPAHSLACDEVEFFDAMVVRAQPAGWDRPVEVRPVWFEAPCVERWPADEEPAASPGPGSRRSIPPVDSFRASRHPT